MNQTKSERELFLEQELKRVRGLQHTASAKYYSKNRKHCQERQRNYHKRMLPFTTERVACVHCGKVVQRRSLNSHRKSKRCIKAREASV
jgi:hypothetical protein